MYTATSQSITEEGKAQSVPLKEWRFSIDNGNDNTKILSDQLIDNEAIAEERARSEFLKGSYQLKEVQFSTYRTDLRKNDVIRVRGIRYLVKGKTTAITKTSIITTVKAVRYD